MAKSDTWIAPVRIEGLRELQASLKALDGESQKQLRVALNDVAEAVVRVARGRVPTRTGAARGSIKVASSQREARVQAGGRKAPYFPWLDYGGKVGVNKSVTRPWQKHGRYLYPAYWSQHDLITDMLNERLRAVATGAGLDVDEVADGK